MWSQRSPLDRVGWEITDKAPFYESQRASLQSLAILLALIQCKSTKPVTPGLGLATFRCP